MRLEIEPRAAIAVRRGHPWIWREGIARRGPRPETGAVVELVEAKGGAPLGRGLFDADSPIAVRVFTRGEERLDAAAIAGAIERAVARRDRWFDLDDTDAFRLCHGEGDRVPGFVLDRYGGVAVLRTDGDAAAAWVDRVAPRLERPLRARGIGTLLLRVDAEAGGRRIATLWGPEPTDRLVVRERGMRMEVDVAHGQKTGAFLDQRENRARVRGLARGRDRVLNLYSYAGGFSVAAALGGAREVTSVDVAGKAHASAQRTFRLNDVDPSAHRFVTADALAHVAELERRGERFDLVISDPPSFAPSERAKERALAAYQKLHQACARLVAPGGVFCAASCSSHVDLDAFFTTLDDAALGRGDLTVVEAFGPPADHPTLAAFPEGRYLKFVVLS